MNGSKIMAELVRSYEARPAEKAETEQRSCYRASADYVCDGCGKTERVEFDSMRAAAQAEADGAMPVGWSGRFGFCLCGDHKLERAYLIDGKEARREDLPLAPASTVQP